MGRGLTNKRKGDTATGSGSGSVKASVELSLADIYRHKLLTPDQEIKIAKEIDLAREKAVRCLIGSFHCKTLIVNLLDKLNNGRGRFDAFLGLPYENDENKAASKKLLATNLKTLKALVKREEELFAKRLSKKGKAELDLKQERIYLKRINGKFLTIFKECKVKDKHVFSLAHDLARVARSVSSIEKRRDELKQPGRAVRQDSDQDIALLVERSVKSSLEIRCYEARLRYLRKDGNSDKVEALEKVLAYESDKRGLFDERQRILSNKSYFDTHEAQQEEILRIGTELRELGIKWGITPKIKKLTKEDELRATRHALLVAYSSLGASADRVSKRLKLYDELHKAYQDAREKLIHPNRKLVVSIAKKHLDRGLPLDDLIAAGDDGLIIAAESYEHSRGNRFSTYATWWIRQRVKGAIKEYRKRGGVSAEHKVKLSRVKDRLSQELGRNPSTEEVLTVWMKDRPTNVQRRADSSKEVAYEHDISTLERGGGIESSLEIRPGSRNGGEECKQDVASSEKSVLESLMESEQSQGILNLVEEALGRLDKREANILRMRFGIGQPEKTLKQVGLELGITRERVRQLELKALQKARELLGRTEENLEIVGGITAEPGVRRKRGASGPQVHTTSSPDSTTSAQSPPSTESSEVPSSRS
jgi:RNA polymerase primary sigma factor